MGRLLLLIVLFVILAALLVLRRRASAGQAAPPDAAQPVAQPAATVALAPQRADGVRDPYARLGSCPTCGRPMVERVGKRGALKGKPYLVCSGDPPCAPVAAEA
jgi:hypothetical protein